MFLNRLIENRVRAVIRAIRRAIDVKEEPHVTDSSLGLLKVYLPTNAQASLDRLFSKSNDILIAAMGWRGPICHPDDDGPALRHYYFEVPIPWDKLNADSLLFSLQGGKGGVQLVELVCSDHLPPYRPNITNIEHLIVYVIQHVKGVCARETFNAMSTAIACLRCDKIPEPSPPYNDEIVAAIKDLRLSKGRSSPFLPTINQWSHELWSNGSQSAQHIICFVIDRSEITKALADFVFHLATPSFLLNFK